MKKFVAPSPDLGTAAVRAFRTRDDAKTLTAVAAATAPFADEVAAELAALAFAHPDKPIAAKAKKLVVKHVAGATQIATALKGIGARVHEYDARLRTLDHPLRLAIGKAIAFHTWSCLSVPFEEDAAFRGAILDVAVERARRDDETMVRLGEIYTEWLGSHGSATSTHFHVFPDALAGELAARRAGHPFTGLSIHGGGLTDLPASLAKAKPWLTALELGWQQFERLPAVIFGLANLETLSLCGTAMSDLPADLAKLRKLRRLDIGNGKRMPAIPAAVCALDQVTHLRIGNGSIKLVPAAIAGMTSLEVLEMQSTSITKLPAEIATLPKLKKIEAKWSRLNAEKTRALLPKHVALEI